jgi:hypothetical protein
MNSMLTGYESEQELGAAMIEYEREDYRNGERKGPLPIDLEKVNNSDLPVRAFEVLRLLRKIGPSTAGQLAEHIDMPVNSIAASCNSLRLKKFVTKDDMQKRGYCHYTKKEVSIGGWIYTAVPKDDVQK